MIAQNHSNRGAGIYTYNEASDDEWFFGSGYQGFDTFSVFYEGASSFDIATTEPAHEILELAQNGKT